MDGVQCLLAFYLCGNVIVGVALRKDARFWPPGDLRPDPNYSAPLSSL